jgi:hypothetical protein
MAMLLAATGPRNTRDGAGCGCGCGLGVDTAAVDALVGEWERLWGAAGHTQGQTEGQEKQAERENEAEMRRVRGPRAAAHLRRLLGHRPVGCGGGGARPPTQ